MPESAGGSPAPAAAGQCPACQRRVRPGTKFCPNCGHTFSAVGTGAAALAAVPAAGAATMVAQAQGDAAAARFAEHWAEIKSVCWLFGLLLATSFVYGMVMRGSPSPWASVAAQATDALIVLAAMGLRWRKLV